LLAGERLAGLAKLGGVSVEIAGQAEKMPRGTCAAGVRADEADQIRLLLGPVATETLAVERGTKSALDPRFPQPGRYSQYGVPEVLRPAVDALYSSLTNSPEFSPEESLVERALLRLLEPWSRTSRPGPLS